MAPVLFKIGPLTITAFYFFGIMASLSSLFIGIRLLSKKGFKTSELIYICVLWASVALIGAKLFKIIYYILTHFELFLKAPMLVLKNVLYMGSMFYGGLAGALLFYLFFIRPRYKERALLILDAGSVSTVFGQAVGRLGCFFSGCCFGKPTDLPWGVTFSKLSTKIHPYSHTAVHPTQLYESVLNLISFIILLFVYRKRKFNGQIFYLYLVNYGLIRFFMEYLRGDVDYIIRGTSLLFSLTVFQLASLLLISSGIFLYTRGNKSAKFP